MSTIINSLSRVASLLLNPKAQRPTLDQRFTFLTYEFQNFYNELSASDEPWTYNIVAVPISPGVTDYLVPAQTGKVMFVTAQLQNVGFGPVSLEFTDLADVSSDFFASPLDVGIAPSGIDNWEDVPFTAQIAFYRQNGVLWFRLPPYTYTMTEIDITFSTGNWIANVSLGDEAVLSQHHQLVEVRTALNLLPGCEWPGDGKQDQQRRENLAKSLVVQEARYAKQFMYEKRSLTQDEVVYRDGFAD